MCYSISVINIEGPYYRIEVSSLYTNFFIRIHEIIEQVGLGFLDIGNQTQNLLAGSQNRTKQ